ncbi:macrophage mannose receptor 1-like [Carassius carassius]|uniref:macrophage mannose receptor 1-like n=1 Tax=Carassius carassius TaxID=217509 RepID=UPI002868555D|nr:macrophage mannose receptor 1-like [Carassius carassius]
MGPEINLMLFVWATCISSVISKQFTFIKQAKTFSDAQVYCREFYGDLASVEDPVDFSRLQAVVSGVTDPGVWIGLKGAEPDWIWSLSDRAFYGEGEAKYRRWKAGQLDNAGGHENCGVLDSNGEFWDIPCTNQQPFICYDGNVPQRYVYVSAGKSWSDAQTHCRQTHTDLVSVRNQDENQQLQNLTNGNMVFIGLYKDAFRWTDNSSSMIRHWSIGEPNGNGACVLHSLLNTWSDEDCNQARPFICQDGVKMQILRMKLRSGQNMDDPVMKVSIMQKIQQKLMTLGMPSDAKLQWRVQSDGAIFHPPEK